MLLSHGLPFSVVFVYTVVTEGFFCYAFFSIGSITVIFFMVRRGDYLEWVSIVRVCEHNEGTSMLLISRFVIYSDIWK